MPTRLVYFLVVDWIWSPWRKVYSASVRVASLRRHLTLVK